MTYEEWLIGVPKEITGDPLWRAEVYRLSLFLGDLAWYDASKLASTPPTRGLSDQLLRAAGSVSANICEGYSRVSGRDQARFYEYALGSARETRDRYFKARHTLGLPTTEHRLQLTTQIVRHLLRMIPKQRNRTLKDDGIGYSAGVAADVGP